MSEARRLRKNASASAAELREFLAAMRGKSPREMLGTVATSSLGSALIQASIGVGAAIAIFTLVPFAWDKAFASPDDNAATEPAAETPAPAPELPPPPDPLADGDRDALDTLGIGETRSAPLDVNPLEGSADDLLKDLQ